jgi:hypothetical protein
MMHERSYTLPFNLNGYESTATKNLFSLSASKLAKKWQEKILLNIDTTEMKKNKEARNCVRVRHLSKKEAGKKNVNLCC